MATIASLLVNLGMNSAGFSSGTKQAKKDFDWLKSSLATGLSTAAFTKSLDLISQAGQAAFGAVSSSIERIDAMGDFAQRLGVSAGKLSEMQYAARRTDTDLETLNTSLEKFVVNLGKANRGGETASVFADLGLNPQALAGLDALDAAKVTFEQIRKLSTVS